MSAVWITVLVLFLTTVAMKAAGPLAVGGRALPERVTGVVSLIAPALIAGLVVYETLVSTNGRGIELDARLVGLTVAVIAIKLHAPLLLVVTLSALATAVSRALV
jgi:branched-subunit amino acid transport protein